MKKSFIDQFLEYFPPGIRFTREQNRELFTLRKISDMKPIEQINKLSLDLGLNVVYSGDVIIVSEKEMIKFPAGK